MSHVFISYARGDTGFTTDLVRDLEQRGVRCWIDRTDIGVAQPWRDEIAEGIRDCAAFLIVLSPKSAESDEVKRELSYAAAVGRRIVPVLYRAVKLPPGVQLALGNVQWVSFDELTYEDAFARLILALVPAEEKPSEVRRPALLWVISAAYVLAGLNFLASFGTCLTHVALRPRESRACLEGLGLPLFDLVLINVLLVLTVGAGIVVFLRKRTALAVLGIHWGFLVLLTAWAFFRGRYGIGLLVGVLVSTAALMYVLNSNRHGKSARGRLAGEEPVRLAGTGQPQHRSHEEVDHEHRGNRDKREKTDGEVP